jgi:hypothetical protein
LIRQLFKGFAAMTNTLLTLTQVTRAALRILHQKLRFIGSINRQYDDSSPSGREDRLDAQDPPPEPVHHPYRRELHRPRRPKQSVTLTVATQKGVDTEFSTAEMTLSIQDFLGPHPEPAMSQLAANVEADALSMINDVYRPWTTPRTPR